MELSIFRTFQSRQEVEEFTDILNTNRITFEIEDMAPAVDTTFVGGMTTQGGYAVKVRQTDFEKVNQILKKKTQQILANFPKDYHLFDFTNDELYEILENYSDWHPTDFLLAQKILNDRGEDVSDERIQQMREDKLNALRAQENGHPALIVVGYILALLGGLIGIFIGHHLSRTKKTLPNGERMFKFAEYTRNHGHRIFYLGILFFGLGIGLRVLDMF